MRNSRERSANIDCQLGHGKHLVFYNIEAREFRRRGAHATIHPPRWRLAPTHRTNARVFVAAFLAAQTRVFGDSAKEAVGTLSSRAVRVDSRIQIEQIREDKWHSKMPQSCRGLVGKCGAFAQCLGRWIFSSKSGFLIVATDTKTEVHQERTFVIWPDQKLKGSVS